MSKKPLVVFLFLFSLFFIACKQSSNRICDRLAALNRTCSESERLQWEALREVNPAVYQCVAKQFDDASDVQAAFGRTHQMCPGVGSALAAAERVVAARVVDAIRGRQ